MLVGGCAVIPHNYAEQDMFRLLFASLQQLDRVSEDIFARIKDRVRVVLVCAGLQRLSVCACPVSLTTTVLIRRPGMFAPGCQGDGPRALH